MRGFTKFTSVVVALASCIMVLSLAGDSRAAKAKQLFDVKLSKPTILITHQNPSLGTCFGGTSQPCDVFQFSSKFTCTDCAQDLAEMFSVIFEIATSSDCNDDVYFNFFPLPNFSIHKLGNKSTFSFPATMQGSNGRDFVLLTLQMNGAHGGTLSISGNADLHTLTAAPVFVGLSLSGDSVSDDDDPADFVCAPVTPTFQNLN